MSRELFDYLTESVFWNESACDNRFADIGDEDLLTELQRLRKHAIAVGTHGSEAGLGLCVGSTQDVLPDDVVLKRAVAYFDRIVVPDPLFRATELCGSRRMRPWTADDPLPRAELVAASRYLKRLTPLVRLGRVRVAPTSLAFESPPTLPVTYSESLYSERVPRALRGWFAQRANVRKVVTDGEGRRLVLRAAPDVETTTIHVDFGQRGRVHGFQYMTIMDVDEENRTVRGISGSPGDALHLATWLEQSVNQSAGDFLASVLHDASIAEQLGCFYMTSCDATAELLGLQARSDGPAFAANAALNLRLPALESASIEQVAQLLEEAPAAFESFRTELRDSLASVSVEMDERELSSEIRKIEAKLAKDQVRAVEAEVRKTVADLKWDIPVAIGRVSLGVIAAIQGAFPLAVSVLHGGIEGLNVLRRTKAHRVLPGYFLWRLGRQ